MHGRCPTEAWPRRPKVCETWGCATWPCGPWLQWLCLNQRGPLDSCLVQPALVDARTTVLWALTPWAMPLCTLALQTLALWIQGLHARATTWPGSERQKNKLTFVFHICCVLVGPETYPNGFVSKFCAESTNFQVLSSHMNPMQTRNEILQGLRFLFLRVACFLFLCSYIVEGMG